MFAVTFDFGQTLADLDSVMLSRRLAELGISVPPDRIERAVPAAWAVYDAAIKRGEGGHPWKTLMHELLKRAGVTDGAREEAVNWLWTEQPKKNLWRRPIAGMIDVVTVLRDQGVPTAIISNSEGHLRELVAELDWADRFDAIIDSGVVGIEKPDPRIFEAAAEALGQPLDEIIHVGDSLAADVDGAVESGMRAIWFRGQPSRAMRAGVIVAPDASAVRAGLVAFGAPISMF